MANNVIPGPVRPFPASGSESLPASSFPLSAMDYQLWAIGYQLTSSFELLSSTVATGVGGQLRASSFRLPANKIPTVPYASPDSPAKDNTSQIPVTRSPASQTGGSKNSIHSQRTYLRLWPGNSYRWRPGPGRRPGAGWATGRCRWLRNHCGFHWTGWYGRHRSSRCSLRYGSGTPIWYRFSCRSSGSPVWKPYPTGISPTSDSSFELPASYAFITASSSIGLWGAPPKE